MAAFPPTDDQTPTDGSFTHTDSVNGQTYSWNGFGWDLVCEAGGGDKYVKIAGDTMTGPLVMDDASMIETVNTDIEMRRTMPDDGSGNWDVNRSRYGIIRSRCPKIIEADGNETLAQGDAFGIQIDLADRNSYRNELKVTSKTEDILRVYSGATPGIEFNDQIDRSSLTASGNDKGIEKGIEIRGIPTPDKDLTPGSYAVNKEYVDQREEFLQQEIIELEEEIQAIAPLVETGLFVSAAGSSGPADGEFFMRTITGKTTNYGDPGIIVIIVSKKDKDGEDHFFSTAEPGQLLHLLEAGVPDNGLYKIESVDGNDPTDTGTTAVTFGVTPVSGKGEATVGDMARLRITDPPSGGDASEFLPLVGGDMTGEVAWDKSNAAPYAGIRLTDNTGSIPNSGRVFYANLGGSFSEPRVEVSIAPTGPYTVTNKEYVDGLWDFSKYQELS